MAPVYQKFTFDTPAKDVVLCNPKERGGFALTAIRNEQLFPDKATFSYWCNYFDITIGGEADVHNPVSLGKKGGETPRWRRITPY